MAGSATIRVTGDVKQALAALESLGLKAEETGKKAETAFGDRLAAAGEKTSGVFQRIGQSMGNWGIPFGESITKMGEKFAEAETKGQKFGAAMSEVGKATLLGAGAGLAAVAGESIHLAESFQQSTASMAAHAGITTQAAQKIGNAFLSTAGQTTFSAQEMETAFAPVAGQFQTMYGHALNAGQSLTFMRAAMDAAEASGSPLADTTKTLASAMMVYHLNVNQAASASDVMWNTSKALGVSVTDLGSSLSRLEPRIAGSGMSIQQTGAFMVELAKEAGNGRQAMRLAGTAIQSMISPSAAAQKALETMGVSLTDSNGKFIGMRAAVGLLHDAFAKLPGSQASVAAGTQMLAAQQQLAGMKTETQTKAVKAQEAALTAHIGVLKLQAGQLSTNSAMQAVFGRNANLMASLVAGGVPAFDAATKAVSKSGTAQAAAETQAQTFHGTMEKLKSTAEDLGVKFGNFLLPKLQELMTDTAGVVNWFEQHKAAAEALAGVIGGVLSVAVGAFAVNKIAGLINGVKSAAETMQGFAGTMTQVAATVLEKLGLIDSETAAKMRSVGASWQGKTATVEATQAQEAATVEATQTAEGAAVESTVAGEMTAIEGEYAGGAAAVESTVGGEVAAVDAEFAGMDATAAADASMASSSLGALGAGLAIGAAASIGSNYLPGAHNVNPNAAGVEKITGQIPIIGSFANNVGNSISGALGFGGPQKGVNPNTYTNYGLNGQPVSDRAPMARRAAGGPVKAGTPYLVGENGPEPFVPDQNGTILPNGSGMGGQQIMVNVETNADPHQIAAEVGWAMRQYATAGI